MSHVVNTAALAAVLLLPAGLSAQAPPPVLSRAEAALPADTAQLYDVKLVQRGPSLARSNATAWVIKRNYPPTYLNARIGGTVFVRFVVDENGMPQNARVVRMEAPSEFAAPALLGVQSMRFHPARDHGSRVRVSIEMPITFDPRAEGEPGDMDRR